MPKTILVVDDSKAILSIIRTVLDVAGYEVLTAADGVEGMALLNSGKQVDIIVTDLNMPNMDGIEFIWEIRKLANHVFTPICMLTTESEQSKLVEGESISIDAWIKKPIQPVHVLNIVSKIVPPD
ncbi:MAG: response regulator [Gammaproteobacteria bacterium]|nr:response regulator [Gammaproteobacteria bacterium]